MMTIKMENPALRNEKNPDENLAKVSNSGTLIMDATVAYADGVLLGAREKRMFLKQNEHSVATSLLFPLKNDSNRGYSPLQMQRCH